MEEFLTASVVGFCILLGMKMRYSHFRETRISGSAQQEVERLTETVDNLNAQIELLHSEFHELNQRIEFTERLLELPEAEE